MWWDPTGVVRTAKLVVRYTLHSSEGPFAFLDTCATHAQMGVAIRRVQLRGRSPNGQPRKRLALHPCCKAALAFPSPVAVKRKVPPFRRCLFLLANQPLVRNRVQHKVLMSPTFLFLCRIQHPHLTCLGIIHHHH